MENDPKKINFQTKEDLIIFLNLTIELTIKHYNRYKEYYAEMLTLAVEQINNILEVKKEKITEDNIIEAVEKCIKIEKPKKQCEKSKFSYLKYKAIEDKISNVQGKLLNLLGDRTSKGGLSYQRFRKEYKKMKKIK